VENTEDLHFLLRLPINIKDEVLWKVRNWQYAKVSGSEQTHDTHDTHEEANGEGAMAEVREWLQRLGEDPETISEVLESCARDPAVMSKPFQFTIAKVIGPSYLW
jgi:hypothetical protein